MWSINFHEALDVKQKKVIHSTKVARNEGPFKSSGFKPFNLNRPDRVIVSTHMDSKWKLCTLQALPLINSMVDNIN